MKGSLSRIERSLNSVEKVMAVVSAAVIVAVTVVTTADVFMRFVLNSPIVGAFEASEFAMVFIVLLSVSYVQSIKGHVNVPLFTEKLSIRAQLTLTIFGYLLGLVALVYITLASSETAWAAYVTGDYAMGLIHYPTWPARSVIPFGLAVLSIRLIIDIVQAFVKLLGPAGTTVAEGKSH